MIVVIKIKASYIIRAYYAHVHVRLPLENLCHVFVEITEVLSLQLEKINKKAHCSTYRYLLQR